MTSAHATVQYRDLDLKIYKDTLGHSWVEGIGSTEGRTDAVPLKVDSQEIKQWVASFREGKLTVETSEKLGQRLFAALFSDQIAARWNHMRRSLDEGSVMRVRLDIRDAWLANLPWELMVSTNEGEAFTLVLSTDCRLTRCIYKVSATKSRPSPTLRVLIVVASPKNEQEFNTAAILAAIRTSLRPHGKTIEVKLLEHATRPQLMEILGAAEPWARKPRYDIVHFIGHGVFDQEEGSLLLETSNHEADPISARDLANVLRGKNTRLLVVTACDLATSSKLDSRLGVATAVLQSGVPATIAMQGSFDDTEVKLFCEGFYTTLADCRPLEFCVAKGRFKIYSNTEAANHAGWAVPVLYSNLDDGVLFEQMPHEKLSTHVPYGQLSPLGSSPILRRHRRGIVARLPAPWYEELLHRQDELDSIRDAMRSDNPKRLIVISGPPGSGSSSLALEIARQYLDVSNRDPESRDAFAGVLWVSRRRPPLSGPFPLQPSMGWDVKELYRQLAEALPVPGLRKARPQERSELVRFALQQDRYLVVVDDLDELRGLTPDEHRTADELANRLPAPTKIIVTSHAPVQRAPVAVPLGELFDWQAADLLRHMAATDGGVRDFTINGSGETFIRRALDGASGNPLALRLLAGRLADKEDVLAVAKERVQFPSQKQEQLGVLIRESLAHCSGPERDTLQTVALYPEPLQQVEIARALNESEEEATRIVAHLRKLGLVVVADDGTAFMSQRISHEALYDLDQDQAAELLRRAIRDTLFGRPWNTCAKLLNATWAASQAYDLHDWSSVVEFRASLHDALYDEELWSEGIELGKRAYDAADRLGCEYQYQSQRAWCALYPIARHYYYQGDYRNARLWSERALDQFERIGEQHGLGSARRSLGRVMHALGFLDEAQQEFEQGLSQPGVNHDMRGHLFIGLAELAERRADYESAQHHYQDALNEYRCADERIGKATAEHGLGRTALTLGHSDEAREHLEQSHLLLTPAEPDRYARALQSLADLEESLDHSEQAQAYLQQARKILVSKERYADLTEIESRLALIEARQAREPSSLRGGRSAHHGRGPRISPRRLSRPPLLDGDVRSAESTVVSPIRSIPNPSTATDESGPSHYLCGQLPERAPTDIRITLLVRVGLESTGHSKLLKPFNIPPEGATVRIIVNAPGLDPLEGRLEQELYVPPDKNSDWVAFPFHTRTPGLFLVRVTAWRGGSFLGELELQVSVERGGHTEEGRMHSAGITAGWTPGSVALQILYDEQEKRYRFQLLSDELFSQFFPSNRLLPEAGEAVERAIQQLDLMAANKSGYNLADTQEHLRQTGIELWTDLLPKGIQEVFWELREHVTSLTIASDYDIIPWELLYPLAPGRDAGFLVEQFPVVRRVYGQRNVATLPLRDAMLVVPPKAPANAAGEVAAVRRRLGHRVSDDKVGELGRLTQLVNAGGFGGLHFACHNNFRADGSGSSVEMVGGAFTPVHLSGAAATRSLKSATPLVFFNACRTASEAPRYTQHLGWARRFMQAGAGGFVGSLWAVRSSSALAFADAFYAALVEQRKPLGEAVQLARSAISRQPKDSTWLAYTVYGDPLATVE